MVSRAWDGFMFNVVIRPRGRIPASDSCLVKRVAGPGLNTEFYYQVGFLESSMFGQLIKMMMTDFEGTSFGCFRSPARSRSTDSLSPPNGAFNPPSGRRVSSFCPAGVHSFLGFVVSSDADRQKFRQVGLHWNVKRQVGTHDPE